MTDNEAAFEAMPLSDPEAIVPVLEALLFASPEPLKLASFRKVFGEEMPEETLKEALSRLQEITSEAGRGILLTEIAGGWQFLTREDYFPFVQKIAKTRAEERITPAAIETLSIIAYKQPVTRAEVDAVRGVASGSLVRILMDRGLVRVMGRAELPGQPFQYGTSKAFLTHFGLSSLKDLPDPRELHRLLEEQARKAPEPVAEPTTLPEESSVGADVAALEAAEPPEAEPESKKPAEEASAADPSEE